MSDVEYFLRSHQHDLRVHVRGDKKRISVGTAGYNTLFSCDPGSAERHFEVWRDENGCHLQDYGKGTLVDDKIVRNGKVDLQNNSKIFVSSGMIDKYTLEEFVRKK